MLQLLLQEKCLEFRASDGDEEQGRAHSCRTTVEPLLAMLQSSDDHADALETRQSPTVYLYKA